MKSKYLNIYLVTCRPYKIIFFKYTKKSVKRLYFFIFISYNIKYIMAYYAVGQI